MQRILRQQPFGSTGADVGISGNWQFPDKSLPARAAALGRPGYRVKLSHVVREIDPIRPAYRKLRHRIESLYLNNEDPKMPNAIAGVLALAALRACNVERVLPTVINPTGDESILLEFFIGEDVYSIDIYNTGEIVFLTKVSGQPVHAVEIEQNQLAGVVAKISHAYECHTAMR